MSNGVLVVGDYDLLARGAWLTHHFRLLGFSPDDFTVVAGINRFDAAVADLKPRCILSLGDSSFGYLHGHGALIDYHGYMMKTKYGIPMVPTFDPDFIIKGNQKMSGAFLYCIKKALAIAANTLPNRTDQYKLLLDPDLGTANAYLANPQCIVADIETNESTELGEDETHDAMWDIVRISFCTSPGSAISLPFRPPYMDIIRATLRAAKSVTFWNQEFDVPRLRAAGCPISGIVYDAMWAWHFLQSDLPKKLGFAAPLLVNVEPWKMLNSALPAKYSALDSAITMDAWLAILQALQTEGRLDAFHEQCSNMLPILGGATDKGMLLDLEEQAKLLGGENELGTIVHKRNELYANLQVAVLPLKNVRPTKVYKKRPPKKILEHESYIPNEYVNGKPNGGTLVKAFNPGSPLQKKALFRALGLPIPYDGRNDKETIESKHLVKYRKRFPMLGVLKDYNEHNKLITSYDWKVEADQRIHPEFGFNPSTWRKNARNPNIQTIPKRSELAKAFRRLFIAAPGHTLIECDSSAIEAVLVGFFAGSERYIALAKRGVHKWLAEKVAGRAVSKEEPLYDKVKRIVHLSNYLGSPIRIAEEYPDDFANVQEARKLQDFYFDQPEGQDVRKWQQATLAAADHDHYMETPFGQRHYFYDVLQTQYENVRLGKDAKRAIAFMPQASASAIQTRYLMTFPDKYRMYLSNGQFTIPYLRAIIHDSIVLEVPMERVDEVARDLYTTMTAPIKELGGLAIGAECKVGPNLRDMKTVTF
jgi:hypothetical protein